MRLPFCFHFKCSEYKRHFLIPLKEDALVRTLYLDQSSRWVVDKIPPTKLRDNTILRTLSCRYAFVVIILQFIIDVNFVAIGIPMCPSVENNLLDLFFVSKFAE